ncbi:MAG: hypothetical protein M1832_004912 [Thelocarpon impressellum]|nr:MAG: hypothetical protein M1832_004912 [Thelocarpon impressellum]
MRVGYGAPALAALAGRGRTESGRTSTIASSDPVARLHSTPFLVNLFAIPPSASPRLPPTATTTTSKSSSTDNPQTWITQPPPSDRHPPAPLPDFTHPPSTDFVLYPPAPASAPQAPRSARNSAELVPAAASHRAAALSQAFNATGDGPHRRNSSQSSSATSAQNRRVTKIIQGSGHSSTSSTSPFHRYSPPGPSARPQAFYASSAPSSSSALPQHEQHPTGPQRPHVPLFASISTGNVHMQSCAAMAASNMPQDMHGLFDLSANYGEAFQPEAPLFDADYASPRFTSVNEPAATMPSQGTVSPKDLVRDPLASAPPSTAFTNLTSPSIFDSPDVADSFETSPMFNSGDADLGADSWFSLFPGGGAGESDASPPNPSDELYEQAPAAGADRRRPSPGLSPGGARGTPARHSSVSGVGARKRDKPLPPICVEDPSDTVAMKRMRNTLAARKSRQKKVQRFDELEQTIEELRGEVSHWKSLALSRSAGGL